MRNDTVIIENTTTTSIERPVYQVWIAAYVGGEIDSQILIMETNVWDFAFVAKNAVNETLKSRFDDYYSAEIRLKGGINEE